MDTVTLARAFFGSSLAFHIIFATLGVGLSLMIFISEILYHWKKDSDMVALLMIRDFAMTKLRGSLSSAADRLQAGTGSQLSSFVSAAGGAVAARLSGQLDARPPR